MGSPLSFFKIRFRKKRLIIYFGNSGTQEVYKENQQQSRRREKMSILRGKSLFSCCAILRAARTGLRHAGFVTFVFDFIN